MTIDKCNEHTLDDNKSERDDEKVIPPIKKDDIWDHLKSLWYELIQREEPPSKE